MGIETFQASAFMPALKETEFYFGKSFRPAEKDLYLPNVPYTFYDVPALGGLGQEGMTAGKGLNLFAGLANLGIGLYSQNQQIKDAKDARKNQENIERIKADAMIAVARANASRPLAVQPASGPPMTLLLGGLAFVTVVGGMMYFITR